MTAVTPTFRQDARIIGVVGLAHGVSHFFHLILAPLFPWLKEAFVLSYAELGLLMTMFFIVSGIGQALAGFVVDRVGARRVLMVGMALLALAALVLAAAQSYGMLLAGSMLAGLGNSVFHPSDYTLLNKRVSIARLGHAFSVHGISGNLGWAAAPVFLATIASFSSWRVALLAAACIPCAMLTILFVYRHVIEPEDSAAAIAPSHKPDVPLADGNFDFLRLPAVWMCFAFFAITALALGGIQSFSSASLRALYGLSLVGATTGYTAYMLASAAGMVWGGFLAARAARHDRIIAFAFAVAGLTALVVATGWIAPWMAVLLMGGIGFGAGVAGPSRDLMIRAAAPKNATGRVYGVVYSGLDIGLAGAPLIFGALMDASHPSWVFVLIGTFQVMAIATAVRVGSNTARRAARALAV
ncbi:FSR family fosmidomycin resistance protein-like MFS transporter [Actimicrobium sp. GrIS 1.19]|uniref:MFS transporter n=1 Tax=Actimicrobium sp. GrIS 1.19 TaxID=3071708 RepID=UPI002DF8D7CA|nr:FSR family fosmidomycin resistance protein-like MFS transporter [Actimicrobium sp. GrIS 1.19]